MLKRLAVLTVLVLSTTTAFGRGDWVLSGGFGLIFDPTRVLVMPQLEYGISNRFHIGPLVQVGFGDPGTIATFSMSGRYTVGNHPRLKPNLEGALGLTTGGGRTGVHIGAGVGLDFQVTHSVSVGSLVRLNFGPPVDDFFLSWPILVARLHL